MEVRRQHIHKESKEHLLLEDISSHMLSILTSLNEAFLLLDKRLDVVYINDKAASIGELSYGFVCKKGDNIIRLMPADRQAPLESFLLQVLAGKEISYEIEIPKADKSIVWLDCCYKPVIHEDAIIGICVMLKDISKERLFDYEEKRRKDAEKKFEENQLMFQAFMQSTPLTAWITDAAGIMHYLNPTFRRLYNIPDDGEPKSMYDIFPKDLADEYFENNLHTIEAGKLTEVLERTQKPDGTLAIYKVFKFPMQVGNEMMIGGWSVEITEDAKMQQQLLLNEEAKKRAIIRSIIETQEKERRELSVQLHDNINQTLSSCKLMLEAAKEHKEQAEFLKEKAYKSLESAILEIRKISHGLNPSSIEDIGLKEAIEDLIANILSSHRLEVRFHYSDDTHSALKSEDKVAIYRIIQEQLNNIALHAKATTATVNVVLTEAIVVINIEDNGQGFDPKKIRKGLGFRNIQNRVEYYHGKLDVQTGEAYGCKMSVTLNLSSAE